MARKNTTTDRSESTNMMQGHQIDMFSENDTDIDYVKKEHESVVSTHLKDGSFHNLANPDMSITDIRIEIMTELRINESASENYKIIGTHTNKQFSGIFFTI